MAIDFSCACGEVVEVVQSSSIAAGDPRVAVTPEEESEAADAAKQLRIGGVSARGSAPVVHNDVLVRNRCAGFIKPVSLRRPTARS